MSVPNEARPIEALGSGSPDLALPPPRTPPPPLRPHYPSPLVSQCFGVEGLGQVASLARFTASGHVCAALSGEALG